MTSEGQGPSCHLARDIPVPDSIRHLGKGDARRGSLFVFPHSKHLLCPTGPVAAELVDESAGDLHGNRIR